MKQHRSRYFWLALPIIAALVIWLKWDNWFYNEPEMPYQISPAPQRVLLSLGEPSGTSRIVTWQAPTQTSKGILTLVSDSTHDTIRIDASSKSLTTQGGQSQFFRSEIHNLKANSLYRYQVANDQHKSPWYAFRMPSAGDKYAFTFIGDVQDSLGGKSGILFHDAVRKTNQSEFMVFIGDMIERPLESYWKIWFDAGDSLFQSVPVIATPGNHEYTKGIIQKIDPRWMTHFPFPQNGPPNFIGRVCYWDYKNTRFISLDSNGIQSFSSAFEQKNWLKEVLEKTHTRWIVVIMHHPIYSTSVGRDYFYLRALLKPLFEQFKVDLVLQGHDHSFGRVRHPLKDGDQAQSQGPVYVVTHASPKLYDISFSEKMDKLASNTQMYHSVYVSNDTLSFYSYTVTGKLFDHFILSKDTSGLKKFSADPIPNESDLLQPTKHFLKKETLSSKIKYQSRMEVWMRERGNK